jgi:hypothetical protein
MLLTLPSVHVRAGTYDPCIDNEVTVYFNRPDVQAALHANQSGNALPYPWAGCSDTLQYSRCCSAQSAASSSCFTFHGLRPEVHALHTTFCLQPVKNG